MAFTRPFDFDHHQQHHHHHHHQLVEEGEEQQKKKLLETKFLINMDSHMLSNTSRDDNKGLVMDQQQQHHHHQHQQIPYGVLQSSSSSASINPGNNFISKEGHGAYDLGELDQALFFYLDGQQQPPQQHQDPSNSLQDQLTHQNQGMRPPTLNIFPSQPMHAVELSSAKDDNNNDNNNSSNIGLVSSSSAAATTSGSKTKQSQPSMENTRNDQHHAPPSGPEPPKTVKREGNNRKGPTAAGNSEQEGPKTPDPKTLRRLAQNREAARKSRLRKKAYVQQLESSRIKLTQLEQELQRARNQGLFFVGGGVMGGEQGLPVAINNITSDAAVFDMEYARWVEEHHRLMCELRAAVQEHLPENELRLFVDNALAHYDQMISLKAMIAKSDVFHLVSGMWKTPAERCFMWLGDFRPSEIIKIILSQIEPLTEQQILGICGLQQSTQEAEEALSQGLETLNQSLSETISSDSLSLPPNMANYMGQMAVAMNKLSTLEGFVRQADNLRHQMIHRLNQILTTRQAARCLLSIAEYFHRLRALSSLWLTRPRQD